MCSSILNILLDVQYGEWFLGQPNDITMWHELLPLFSGFIQCSDETESNFFLAILPRSPGPVLLDWEGTAHESVLINYQFFLPLLTFLTFLTFFSIYSGVYWYVIGTPYCGPICPGSVSFSRRGRFEDLNSVEPCTLNH